MLSTVAGASFVFDADGVWHADTARCIYFPHAGFVEEASQRMWSLIDHTPHLIDHPHDPLLNAGLLFPVLAVRYEEKRYGSWLNHTMGSVEWFMDPWEAPDLARWSVPDAQPL